MIVCSNITSFPQIFVPMMVKNWFEALGQNMGSSQSNLRIGT